MRSSTRNSAHYIKDDINRKILISRLKKSDTLRSVHSDFEGHAGQDLRLAELFHKLLLGALVP